MRTADFTVWLRDTYLTQKGKPLQSRPQGDALSRCRRVELVEGNLDKHFTDDGLHGLVHRLTYSADDVARGHSPLHMIVIDGDVLTGTASLCSAIRLYQEFCRRHPPPIGA